MKCWFVAVVALEIISRSSGNFVDIAIAYHLDDFDVDVIQQFEIDFIKKFARQMLPSGNSATQMALILGLSDGQTRVMVSLTNSSSGFVNAKIESYLKRATSQSQINVSHETFAIFERINKTVFNGQRNISGDRPEAPNFLILFTQTSNPTDAADIIRVSLQKGADAVVAWSNVSTPTNFDYEDWDKVTKNFSGMDEIIAQLTQSIQNALGQCEYKPKPVERCITGKRCPCVRELRFEINKSSRYCPKEVDDAPCNETCDVQLELEPMPTYQIIMIVWVVMVSIPIILCPYCSICVAWLVKKYTPTLIEYVIDEGDRLTRECAKDAYAAVRKSKGKQTAEGSEAHEGEALEEEEKVEVVSDAEVAEAVKSAGASGKSEGKSDAEKLDAKSADVGVPQGSISHIVSEEKEEVVEQKSGQANFLKRLKQARFTKMFEEMDESEKEKLLENVSSPKAKSKLVNRKGLMKRVKSAGYTKKSASPKTSKKGMNLLQRLKIRK